MLSFILAISPIVIVLVGIMAFRMSASKVAPLALLWGMFLALTYFNITGGCCLFGAFERAQGDRCH